jgi:hypothetical protein
MKTPSQARFETNDNVLSGKMHEKGYSFPKDFSDLSAGRLKELCEGIDRSFIVVCRPYAPGFRAGDGEGRVCAVNLFVINDTSSLLSALEHPLLHDGRKLCCKY